MCKTCKLSQDVFIERCNNIHNNKYDYSKVVYINNREKIDIICNIHGEFKQKAACHLQGQNCPKCAREIVTKSLKQGIKTFIEKADKIHNNFYDYSKTEYVGKSKKLTIICPIHGEFKQKSNSHLTGKGCPECGRIKISKASYYTSEEFIKRAKEKHNEFYTYLKTNYISSKTKVIITCPEHGDFLQMPKSHLEGHGCQKCKIGCAFRKNEWISRGNGKEGIVYIIKCYNESEEFYKIGITFKSTKIRYKDKTSMPYNYEIIKEIKSYNLEKIWNLEKELQKMNKNYNYKPNTYFAGASHECFSEINIVLNYLLDNNKTKENG